MPENVTDEVVNTGVTVRGGNSPAPRRVFTETVNSDQGAKSVLRDNSPVDEIHESGQRARPMKESTRKLLEQLGKPAPTAESTAENVTDAVESAPAEAEATEEPVDTDDVGLEEAAAPPAEAKPAEAKPAETPDPTAEWRTAYARIEAQNRQLLTELDGHRKKPAPAPPDTFGDEFERSYVDEGSEVAIRKAIARVLNAAPDSKEVDAELSAIYTDLTARELNVPLDQSTKAIRDAARARLALARDKRERKAELEAKNKAPEVDEDAMRIAGAAPIIENRLSMKREGQPSLAETFPLLMACSETFDGMKPAVLLAHAIKHEVKVGTLDPTLGEDALITHAARLIEGHYERLAEKLTKAKPPKPDTTPPGDPKKTANAQPVSTEQRQSTGTRTISNASASVAPATSPKTKPATPERPKYRNDKERRQAILDKHLGPKG